jgi:tetratricopeptide (TPR) repeat protein
MNRAIALYQQAIDRDPSFAEAYVGLAIVLNEAGTDGRLQPDDAYPRSRAAVAKALGLNPLLASAYAARGWIAAHCDWDWSAADRDLRRAIEMNPAEPESHHVYSHLLLAMGRFEESLAESRRALELDPLNAGLHVHLVMHFGYTREFAKALDAARTALDIDPAVDAWPFALYASESMGSFDQAIEARTHLRQAPELIAALRDGLRAAGPEGYWRAVRDAELDTSKDRQVNRRTLARAYARLGQRREALDWLERAFGERDPWLVYLKADNSFDGLRGDPRFDGLVGRLGLPASVPHSVSGPE